MWPNRYFPHRYWPGSYWAKVGGNPITRLGHLICTSISIAPLAGVLSLANLDGSFEITQPIDGSPDLEQCD